MFCLCISVLMYVLLANLLDVQMDVTLDHLVMPKMRNVCRSAKCPVLALFTIRQQSSW